MSERKEILNELGKCSVHNANLIYIKGEGYLCEVTEECQCFAKAKDRRKKYRAARRKIKKKEIEDQSNDTD